MAFSFLLLSLVSIAQDFSANASLENNSIQIGQQVKLNLSITYKVDGGERVEIQWPQILDTLRKEIEIVSQSPIDTIIPDSSNLFQFEQRKTLLITSFDSGYWAIAPIKFTVNKDSSGVFTSPLLLEVKGVAVDTTLAIKDIKQPFQVQYTWIDWIKDNPYKFWGTLTAILLVLLGIYLFKKYYVPKPEIIEEQVPKIPAHLIALEKLDKLKNEKLWQEGKVKLFHIKLSEIIREYIEDRFNIWALEQTTDEIIYGFRNVAIDEESKAKLKQVLVLSDLVKFAKEQTLPNENELSLSNAYDFVKGTLREEKPAPPAAGQSEEEQFGGRNRNEQGS